MQTQFEFIKSLKPGDIITTVGVKNVEKKSLVTDHSGGRTRWSRYARVSDVSDQKSSEMKSGDVVGVRLEGLYPDVRDALWHMTGAYDKTKPMARKASVEEHAVYMHEYLKCRKQLNEHRMKENKEEAKKLRSELRSLQKIADAEGIDIDNIDN